MLQHPQICAGGLTHKQTNTHTQTYHSITKAIRSQFASAVKLNMWQVRFPKGWHDIDADAQLSINNAYDAGHSTVQFQVLQSQR